MDSKPNQLWWILRIGLGVIFVVSGADKFTNLMTFWPEYVAEPFASLMPWSAQTFMHIVGPLEIVLGLAMLVSRSRLAGYAATLWMLAVAVNLIAGGLYDLASRDIAIALGTFAVARLAEITHPTRAHAHAAA